MEYEVRPIVSIGFQPKNFGWTLAAITIQVPATGRMAQGKGQGVNGSIKTNDAKMSKKPPSANSPCNIFVLKTSGRPDVARNVNPPAAISQALVPKLKNLTVALVSTMENSAEARRTPVSKIKLRNRLKVLADKSSGRKR